MNDCDTCRDNWHDDPPCSDCRKPDSQDVSNETALRAWTICNKAGRDGMSGMMQASQIIATLAAIGGTEQDIDKVLLLEDIFREHNKPEEEQE